MRGRRLHNATIRVRIELRATSLPRGGGVDRLRGSESKLRIQGDVNDTISRRGPAKRHFKKFKLIAHSPVDVSLSKMNRVVIERRASLEKGFGIDAS